MRLQPPDQLSTVLIWLSAIIMALKQAVETWPDAKAALPAMTAGWLNFVPLVLLVLAAVITMLRSARHEAPEPSNGGLAERASVVDRIAPPTQPYAPPPYPTGDPKLLPEAVARQFRELKLSQHTEIQEMRFLRQYLGKWLVLTASIQSLDSVEGGMQALCVFQDGKKRSSALFVLFDRKWEDHLAHMTLGDPLTFRAQILEVRPNRIRFANAEPI